MGSIPREQIAKNGIFGIGRAPTYDVARVKVAHHERNFPGFKPIFDLLVQKQTDVNQPDVSRGIAFISSVAQQILSRSFGDSNDCVPAVHNPLFQRGEKSAFALQLERQLGDESEIYVLPRPLRLGLYK